jgi:hypothetical protein
MSKVNMVILDRYVPTVLEELLPNDEWSKVGYGAHAVDVEVFILMKTHDFTRGSGHLCSYGFHV